MTVTGFDALVGVDAEDSSDDGAEAGAEVAGAEDGADDGADDVGAPTEDGAEDGAEEVAADGAPAALSPPELLQPASATQASAAALKVTVRIRIAIEPLIDVVHFSGASGCCPMAHRIIGGRIIGIRTALTGIRTRAGCGQFRS
ncbi:hypothetical protein GCM10011575_12560 [Microlunatus endophyticus]|uniref:Uncharacterized protein n=1 Tax=Microlunatus endophyticus TaxID=1716077 RepID=A0A917S587_9ACTN|nr:hypothetical protein GCM10011575_12560 [Microlunatus endophyticus]